MRIVVTGGAGYIGSHTAIELLRRGHDVSIIDNFSNSSPLALGRIATIAGQPIACENMDLRDSSALTVVLNNKRADAVIHLAGLKAVGESCTNPLKYFDNNIVGTISLLNAMQAAGTRMLVFSSSATVYGQPERNPISEVAPRHALSPYARSKIVSEDLIGDICAHSVRFRAAILRYFNPVGAHPSGLIGELAHGTPGNLMPYICQVAAGRRAELPVFGADYPTRDGTGLRDYLHVVDLARAHVDAVDYLVREDANLTVNLGSGRGFTVFEMIRAFERTNGTPIPFRVLPRRLGDVAEVFADVSLSGRLLGWRAEQSLERMCEDAWRWQSMNPDGFDVETPP